MVVLAVVALAVHLISVAESSRHVPFQIPVIDAASYHNQAVALVDGHAPAARAFWQPPLYPYWLALVYAAFSKSVLAARTVQGVLLALTALMTYAAGRRVAGSTQAFVAALLVCFYGPLVFFTGMLLPNAMAVALDMVALLCLLRWVERPTRAGALACGLAVGVAALAVPNVQILIVPVMAWLFWRAVGAGRWRENGALGLWVLVGLALSIGPVAVRNRLVAGEWVPISTNGGINLYVGNNPHSDATVSIRPGDEWDRLVARPYVAGAKSDSEADAFFFREVGRYVASAPADFVKGMCRKAARFWSAREMSRNVDVEYFCSLSSVLRPLVWSCPWLAFPFGIVGALGIYGLLTTLGRHRGRWAIGVFILLYAFSVILFFPASRYKLPIIPPLMIFAVLGADQLIGAVRLWNKRSWACLAAFAAVLVLVNWPLKDPVDHVSLNAELHTDVGVGLYLRGRLAEALEQDEIALAIDPRSADAHYYRGVTLRDLHRTEAAVASFRQCLALRPDHPRAMLDLATLLYQKEHRTNEAIEWLSRLLALHKDHRQAMINLAIVLTDVGRKDEAAGWLKKAGMLREGAGVSVDPVSGSRVSVRQDPRDGK